MHTENKKTINNTIMLYMLTVAKLIFPLLTLPYLTRVLSTDCYGMVTYVKSCMVYSQLIVDFGFILSSVKDIVLAKGDLEKVGIIAGHTFVSKLLLVVAAFAVIAVMTAAIPLLRANALFTLLSFVVVAVSALLADFLFRGIEKMHIITIVFVVMKGISTVLTFVAVKGDATVLWIPVLDIISSVIAVGVTWFFIFKLKIKIRFKSFRQCLKMIKESFGYFISDAATTAFGALNTLLIGIFITDLTEVAYWGVCMQIISAIQNLYAPINNGIYPYMIRNRDLKLIHKVMLIFMPIVIIGSAGCFILAKTVLHIIGGGEYERAYIVFRALVPLLVFSFPAMLYGWPALGAIGRVKETSATTIITAILQVIGLGVLILGGWFTVFNIAVLRCITEFAMMSMRMGLTYKHKKEFVKAENCNEKA